MKWNRYEQISHRANALREELHTQVERILNDVIKFKVHIQKSLEDYEGFVIDEVEQELTPSPPLSSIQPVSDLPPESAADAEAEDDDAR